MNSYHVLELVGEGSFGRVYKGRKRFTGQIVALKFIPKVGRSEKELRGLKREIEIMRGLQHPNIVQMFDSFETETEVVVVTEYAEGELFQILQDDGNLPERQVQEIACQLVSALYYLHSHRILHRDMKPQNILLGKGGIVKLCDFGFARAMSVSTLVLTSIKGTPLYMSPELVEEKPYDHTADLWSLGCILYELHTGAPPFYTNSIFQLVHLIVRDPVKWPESMSQSCTSFLKGLLTKNPQKRLSWPNLLHHPFVADRVLALPDTSVFSPFTVPPSPDVLALKHQQLMEKTVPGQSRLLCKAREQMEDNKKTKRKAKCGAENRKGDLAPARPVQPTALSSHVPVTPNPTEQALVLETANLSLIGSKTKSRGQISKDYEQEFPSIEIGPRLMRSYSENSQSTLFGKENQLDEETDPYQQNKALDLPGIIPELINKLLAFKSQLVDGDVATLQQIQMPLKDLHKLILTSDLVSGSPSIGNELGLPQLLFELVNLIVDLPGIMEQPWRLAFPEQIMLVLLVYWERHWDWVEAESRLEEFSKPFVKLLNRPWANNIIPLAASVLFMFIDHAVSVDVGMDTLATVLKHLSLLDKAYCSLPQDWGVFDGLLSLVYYILTKNEDDPQCSYLAQGTLRALWIKIGASLEKARHATALCSVHGLYTFLSTVLFVFTKDPHMCVPLFSEMESKCIYTLGLLLDTKRVRRLAPCRLQEESTLSSLSVLSCYLLCFPFALDIPSKTMAGLLQLYHCCGVVQGLLQTARTLPLPLLEPHLSLLSRLLLGDPGRAVPCLRAAAAACGFFSPRGASRTVAPDDQSPEDRTASSLLAALLQPEELWNSAVELLTLLAQVLRCSRRPTDHQLHVDPVVLQQGLAHSQERVRAATCSVLGNLELFESTAPHSFQRALFRDVAERLRDPSVPVRRMACRAVGNWLGFVGEAPVLTQGGDHEERHGWMEACQGTAALLVSLVSDPDALTRHHCCAALGNLMNICGGASVLMKEDVPRLLLTVACMDSHNTVRQAAIATLCSFCQHDAVRQALVSLDAYKILLQASDHALPQCDYLQLMDQLGEKCNTVTDFIK